MYWEVVTRKQKRSRKTTYTLRFYVLIKSKRKTANFKLTGKQDTLYRNHQHLDDLFWDVEDRQKDGGELSEQSKLTIRKIQDTDPEQVEKWMDEGWFHTVTCFTLGEAYEDFMKSVGEKKKWRERTFDNYQGYKKVISQQIPLDKKVNDITLRTVGEAFTELRNKYAWSTFKKPAESLMAVFEYLRKNKDIPENPLEELSLSEWNTGEETDNEDEYVKLEHLEEVLARFEQHELQTETLMAYWRYMGARRFDPIGDHWEDFDEDNATMIRFCIKDRKKLEHPCPIHSALLARMIKWKEEVIAKHGKASGPIFPWLNHCYEKDPKGASVWNHFKRKVLRLEDELWNNLIQSLRSSRSKEYRRLPNGRYLESIWIGHSEKVADESYDGCLETDLDLVRGTASKGEAA